jgi:hypothetical protein
MTSEESGRLVVGAQEKPLTQAQGLRRSAPMSSVGIGLEPVGVTSMALIVPLEGELNDYRSDRPRVHGLHGHGDRPFPSWPRGL